MSTRIERQRIIVSLMVPVMVVGVLWLVQLVAVTTRLDVSMFGVLPLKIRGLVGIVTSPLVHSSWEHLISNSVPLFLLSWALYYYYHRQATSILIISWVLPGLWVWFFARGNAAHIGASGVVYALASYHFFSGLIRRNTQLLAFSLVVIFFYGSMVWGVFPDFFPEKNISWESHLMGGIAGLLLALYFRKTGPQRKKPEFPEYDEEWERRIRMKHGYSFDELSKETSDDKSSQKD